MSSSEKDKNVASEESQFLSFPIDVNKPRRSIPEQANAYYNEIYDTAPDYVKEYFNSADPEYAAQNAFVSRNNSLARKDMTRRIDKIRSDADRQLNGDLSWYEKALLYNPLFQNTIGTPVYNPLTHNMEYVGSDGLIDGLLGGLYNFGKAFVSGVKGDPDWGRRQDEAVVSKVRDKYKFWDDYQKDVLDGKAPLPKPSPSVEFYTTMLPQAFRAAAANAYDLSPYEALRLKSYEAEMKVALERYKILASRAKTAAAKEDRRQTSRTDALNTFLGTINSLLDYSRDNIFSKDFTGDANDIFKGYLSSAHSSNRSLTKFLNELTPEERVAYTEAIRKWHLLSAVANDLTSSSKASKTISDSLFPDPSYITGTDPNDPSYANSLLAFAGVTDPVEHTINDAHADIGKYYSAKTPVYKDLADFFSVPYIVSKDNKPADSNYGFFGTPDGQKFLAPFYTYHAAFSDDGLFPVSSSPLSLHAAASYLSRLVPESTYKYLLRSNLIGNMPGTYPEFLKALALALASVKLPLGNINHKGY